MIPITHMHFLGADWAAFRIPDEVAVTLLHAILTSTHLPTTVAQHAATLLLQSLVDITNTDDDSKDQKRSLLSGLQQRYPKIVQVVAEELSQNGKKDVIHQIMLSLVMVSLISVFRLIV